MSTGEIAQALAAFQADMPTVAKNKTAKVPTKTGGSYSYTYADLADVTEAAMPLLAKHGLSFACLPGSDDHGQPVLTGTLLHTSGESLAGSLPIRGATPQEVGSSLTYMRRYLLGCITGLVTDDDEDGALATNAKPRTRKAAEPKPPPVERDDNAVTEAQIGKIGAAMSKRGLTVREDALAYVESIIGRPVASRNELTKAEASRVIDALETPIGAPA